MPQIRFPGESPEHRRARALRERVDDLRGARQRIIDAADAERRRIERDLHDGAQQRLVARGAHPRPRRVAARERPGGRGPADRAGPRGGPARRSRSCASWRAASTRRVLSDRGLGAALEALAARAPVPVRGQRRPVGAAAPGGRGRRLLRHRRGADQRRQVRARERGLRAPLASSRTACACEVRDDGVGGAEPSTGSGLRGLRDRVDALDGQLELHSPRGGGTTVTVEIPLRASRMRRRPRGRAAGGRHVEPARARVARTRRRLRRSRRSRARAPRPRRRGRTPRAGS